MISINQRFVRPLVPVSITALAIKLLLILGAWLIPAGILDNITGRIPITLSLINFAPEVWLSLLALVFGTLIIVISIASEKTPKLIDLFVTDYGSRLYVWLISLSSLEIILLQGLSLDANFISNLVFINCFVMLPICVVLAIPYVFYILKYTRSTDVIERIYSESIQLIDGSKRTRSLKKIEANQQKLIENIDELHDYLQYTQFKRPKAEIINSLAALMRYYILTKPALPVGFMKLSKSIQMDFSFRTLEDKYGQIQRDQIFFEYKILKAIDKSYLLLIKDGHYDLASLCGNELSNLTELVVESDGGHVTKIIVRTFNTLVRHGINHGLRSREIRSVYNILYHYSRMVRILIKSGKIQEVLKCTGYFHYYAMEANRLARTDASFSFLVEVLASELRESLIALHHADVPKEYQEKVLTHFNSVCGGEAVDQRQESSLRTIQLTAGLFYLSRGTQRYLDSIIDSILSGVSDHDDFWEKLTRDFVRIAEEPEEFWEETDQGHMNIYYSPNKDLSDTLFQMIKRKQENPLTA